MHDQGLKTPEKSMWALFIVYVSSLIGSMGGPAWQFGAGVIIIVIGLWTLWNIGRWTWLRYGPIANINYTR
jgi:hypothetical protein